MAEIKRNAMGQFQKGTDSPNPGGRPKGSITKIMREFMYEIDDSGFSRVQQLCIILWDAALKGDLTAMKLIMDRVDGTPQQTIETNVRELEPIKVIQIGDDDDEVIIGHQLHEKDEKGFA